MDLAVERAPEVIPGRFAGRAGIVTGAASGIGAAIAARLRAEGAEVLAVDQTYPPDADLVPNVRGEFNRDLLTSSGNRDVASFARERFGRVDFLVPNAGFQHVAPVASFPEERFDSIHRILLKSPWLLAKHCWHDLEATSGTVVCIASAHGLVASPYKTAYNAAKHGVLGLIKTLALEGAPVGIRVNAVCPGVVRTPLVEKQIADQAVAYGIGEDRVLEDVMLAPHAVKRLIEPDEVAAVVAFLLSADASAITGTALSVDLGWTTR